MIIWFPQKKLCKKQRSAWSKIDLFFQWFSIDVVCISISSEWFCNYFPILFTTSNLGWIKNGCQHPPFRNLIEPKSTQRSSPPKPDLPGSLFVDLIELIEFPTFFFFKDHQQRSSVLFIDLGCNYHGCYSMLKRISAEFGNDFDDLGVHSWKSFLINVSTMRDNLLHIKKPKLMLAPNKQADKPNHRVELSVHEPTNILICWIEARMSRRSLPLRIIWHASFNTFANRNSWGQTSTA